MKLWPPTFAQKATVFTLVTCVFLIMFCALFGTETYLENMRIFFMIFMLVIAFVPFAALVAVGAAFVTTISVEYTFAFYRSCKTGRPMSEFLDNHDADDHNL